MELRRACSENPVEKKSPDAVARALFPRKLSKTCGAGLLLIALAMFLTQCAAAYEPARALMTRAKQVRELTPAEAATGAPVHLRGVVTAIIKEDGFAIQDSTAGVYVKSDDSARCHIGDLVEVFGVTAPGFAPIVQENTLRILGKGQLPHARFFSMNDIAVGQQDAQWGKMRGIVRTAAIDWAADLVFVLTLADANGEFRARVSITPAVARELDTSQWIGREVMVEGVCGSLFNERRQFSGAIFHVPDLSHITVEAPAQEVQPSSLMMFSPDQSFSGRARVRGVVSYQELGSALYLQSDRTALRVLTVQQTKVEPGDIVEAVGFPNVGAFSPVLENAIFKVVGRQSPPAAISIDPGKLEEQVDGLLVQVEGTVVAEHVSPEGMDLSILSANHVFDAIAPNVSSRSGGLPPVNSSVRISGIYQIQSGGPWGNTPIAFHILIPSLSDVKVLSAPSWWGTKHAKAVFLVTGGALLFFVVWSTYLGRKVRMQFEIIQDRIKSGAILQERNRIARELHDSLEQDLLGINMQLDLVADRMDDDPALAHHALDLARNMGRRSIVGTRKSVWDLRCHWLENGDLASAIRRAMNELPMHNHHIHVRIEGVPRKQPVTTEMNILRIAQEGVANSLKHAQPTRIDVALSYTQSSVTLDVIDDGAGFAVDESLFNGNGHFGLLDMRERADAINGQLAIHSEQGVGTHVCLTVPCESTAESIQHSQVD